MSKPPISSRALETPPSPIRKLAHLAQAAKAKGVKVYHLNIGQPDIASPPEFYQGIKAFNKPTLAYEDSSGNLNLRRAWANFLNRSSNLSLDAEDLLITTGASEGLIFIFMVTCDPGDEVIVFDPTYANYMGFAAITGVRLKPLMCQAEQGFALPDLKQIRRRISAKTRAILLCNPNNPSGTVYQRKELEGLIALCNEYRLFLVVDETYREFVYDGLKPLSALEIAPGNQRLIIIDSLSKRFSLCGARIGCVVTKNKDVIAFSLNLAQARLAAPTIEQEAAAFLLPAVSRQSIEDVRLEYQKRRDVLVRSLQAIPGVAAVIPQGAFYCMARLPVKDAEAFAAFMLRDFSLNGETTFIAPAGGFYVSHDRGASEARLAFVLDSSQIEQAVSVLAAGLREYK
jgi:aspartate aminotransferase